MENPNQQMSREAFNVSMEDIIRRDQVAGNFQEIDHVWVRNDLAIWLGLGQNKTTTLEFGVPEKLDIVIRDIDELHPKDYCQIRTLNGPGIPIELTWLCSTGINLSLHTMRLQFREKLRKVDYKRLPAAHIWMHSGLAMLASALCDDISFEKILTELLREKLVRLPQITFKVNRPFKVICSDSAPKSTRTESAGYNRATVDENDWIVGEKPVEGPVPQPT